LVNDVTDERGVPQDHVTGASSGTAPSRLLLCAHAEMTPVVLA
jgi:hypothetical protein